MMGLQAKWTSERPGRAGLYWGEQHGMACVVHIRMFQGELLAFDIGPHSIPESLDDFTRWSPIFLEPKEREAEVEVEAGEQKMRFRS